MGVTVLSGKADFDKAVSNENFVIVHFTITSSKPCEKISPTFENLSEEYSGLKFYKVDIDETELDDIADVRVVPTFAIWKNGQKYGASEGAHPDALVHLIKTYV